MTLLKWFLFPSMLMMLYGSLVGQVSHGGLPISLGDPAYNVGVPLLILPAPDVAALIQDDATRDAARLLLRDAVVVPTEADINSNGLWFERTDGSRLWRLDIAIPGAFSLEVFFDAFDLPPGGKVFIISGDGSEYVGGYTEENNRSSGHISMDMVRGESIRLELLEPADQIGQSELSILDIGYRYRDVIGHNNPLSSGVTQCQVPIGCEEGNAWTEVAKSVVRMRSRVNGSLFWATGTLVDNTAHDCRPLILTSMKSSLNDGFQSTVSDYSFFRFYFSPVSEACSTQYMFDLSVSGCTHVGDSNDDGGEEGSDFLLLELSNTIPDSYPVFYSGWTASEEAPPSAVAIHHPYGASRMIATEPDEPTISGWEVFDTHWRVVWSSTLNGRGYMDLGSTGAPLFDPSGRVIGTYTGGNGMCEGAAQPDFFGRFSKHWTSNPNPPAEKLKELLDPIDSAEEQLPGAVMPCDIVDDVRTWTNDDFSVYPNPSTGTVHIILPSGDVEVVSIHLYNHVGQENRAWSHGLDSELSLNGLAPGVYHLALQMANGHWFSQRLVILE